MDPIIYSNNKLPRAFFNASTLTVAKALLGKILVFKNHYGIITETEAYMGFDDPASHAAKGRTQRTELMFGPPGFSYVYLIYGMYHCLNFVTEKQDFPAAVLIRGLKLIEPFHTNSSKPSNLANPSKPVNFTTGKLKNNLLDGPGKICRYLGITREHNGIDIITSKELYVAEPQKSIKKSIKRAYEATPRIGISVGQDKLWRFILKHIY